MVCYVGLLSFIEYNKTIGALKKIEPLAFTKTLQPVEKDGVTMKDIGREYETFHQVCAANNRTVATFLLKSGSADINERDKVWRFQYYFIRMTPFRCNVPPFILHAVMETWVCLSFCFRMEQILKQKIRWKLHFNESPTDRFCIKAWNAAFAYSKQRRLCRGCDGVA